MPFKGVYDNISLQLPVLVALSNVYSLPDIPLLPSKKLAFPLGPCCLQNTLWVLNYPSTLSSVCIPEIIHDFSIASYLFPFTEIIFVAHIIDSCYQTSHLLLQVSSSIEWKLPSIRFYIYFNHFTLSNAIKQTTNMQGFTEGERKRENYKRTVFKETEYDDYI